MGIHDDESITRGLARAAGGGDDVRFGELFQHLASAVFAWARLRIPRELCRQIDPDDLVQDVWIRAYGAFGSYDAASGPFRPWLFGVAKHTLLDLIRRARARQPRDGRELSPTDESVHLSRIADNVTSLSRRLARDESIQHFLDDVAGLDDEDRGLLVHIGLEGMRVVDAADRTGLSRGAAFKRWQRLRARLAARPLPEGLIEAA